MNGWLRKVRAGLVVALAFGMAWGTIVWLSFLGAILVASGFGSISAFGGTAALQMFVIWLAIGVVHGAVVATAMSLTGGKWTVDTFPRWLGAVIGGGIGAMGWLLLVLLSGPGGGPGSLAASTMMMSIVGLFGAVSTTTLLTVARRGALPPHRPEPEQIGS
jgi:hypothetical protein